MFAIYLRVRLPQFGYQSTKNTDLPFKSALLVVSHDRRMFSFWRKPYGRLLIVRCLCHDKLRLTNRLEKKNPYLQTKYGSDTDTIYASDKNELSLNYIFNSLTKAVFSVFFFFLYSFFFIGMK